MPSFLTNAQRAFFKLFWLFFPLIILVPVLWIPDETLAVEYKAIITMIMTCVEMVLIWKIAVPWISEGLAEMLSSSDTSVAEDAVIAAARQLTKQERFDDALSLYEQYVRDHKKSLNAWMLRGDFLTHDLGRYAEAVDVYKEALHTVRWNKQNKAFFLYRIGKLYADHLGRPEKAADYWNEAAGKYPKTAYGKEAAKRL